MKIKYIAILTTTAFLLHIVWENMQAPLYTGYQSFLAHFPMCLVGTFGDVIVTFFALIFFWLIRKDKTEIASDFLALAIAGFITAVLIEQNALLTGKWDYASTMPLIPYLHVGLMPILQMTILLPFSFYLAKLFNKKLYENI